MSNNQTNEYQMLANVFSLTAYFRFILNQKFSPIIINYLLKNSWLSQDDLKNRWDNFDKVFNSDYWKLISALSFCTITEAMWYLTDRIIKTKDLKNTIIIELGCWFSNKWLRVVDAYDLDNRYYFETDRKDVIDFKKWFYDEISEEHKTPTIQKLDVLNRQDFIDLFNQIKILKYENDELKNIFIFDEWVTLYLNKEEQKQFFENLRFFWNLLKDSWFKVEHMTPDIPSHENFTNWLVHEWFSLKDHLDVMQKVDPKIINALHNTEEDFFRENWIDTKKIKKYYYDELVISKMKTHKLVKYNEIEWLKDKIRKFLKQEILFAWEMEL